MLQEITIANEASYVGECETLAPLKPINFIFGTNGSGKTTISRVIQNPNSYASCILAWKNGLALTRLVYNSDFVANNFTLQELRGIFTLGETAKDALNKIEGAKAKVQDLEGDIARRKSMLGPEDASSGTRERLRLLREECEKDLWKIKTKHDSYFKNAFIGFRSSQAKFCDKMFEELAANTSEPRTLEDLKRTAVTLFEEGLGRHTAIPVIDVTDLLVAEHAPVLTKKVIGKEDVDVAALIRRLGNSDWVKQGLPYLDRASQCPFCQQEVEAQLATRLNDYFDEAYLNDLAAIAAAFETYNVLTDTILENLNKIIALDNPHLAREPVQADIDRLAACFETNKRLLEAKKREPSMPVTLKPSVDLVEPIIAKMAAANASIIEHNALVDNIVAERGTLIARIWKCLLDENKTMIEKYRTEKDALDKEVQGLTTGIVAKERQLVSAKLELRELEKNVTSVQPTVNAINGLLASFGFSGFRLRIAGERDHLYEIVRDNGDNAAATLSEGEKSFVCFLYFYHLLHGSMLESDITSNRIVVFDDPVSSLDSDVLFIVSALIKRVFREACEGSGQIKQVFLLTHNVYFHKEVSFDPKREAQCRTHETFWIVRKVEGASKIVGYDYNPIKTSYELLWTEVRNPKRSNMTIQNILRRIVENYFKILGNVDTDKIIAMFEGKDQQVCASLFSWVNAGSHSAHDDFYISPDDVVVSHYLKVFRRIFEKTDHLGHYKMMIGSEDPTDLALGAVTSALEATT